MEQWYEFARGPVLRLALVVGIVGLLRHFVVAVWGMADAVRHAQDKAIPYRDVLLRTLGWAFPFFKLHRRRVLYSVGSFVFHMALLVGALFLTEHLALLKGNVGLGWPTLPRPASDVVAVITLVSGLGLLGMRLFTLETRQLSRAMDYALMLLLIAAVAAGALASRSWNPFSYYGTMFVHVLCAAAVFFLMPFTKLTHCVLFPVIRLSSEIAWHFRPQAGRDVLKTLTGTEERVI